MARVTVEDCLENVDNRFELVMLSSKRARQLATGGYQSSLKWDGDKPTVVALREISEGLITPSLLDARANLDKEFEEPVTDVDIIIETTSSEASAATDALTATPTDTSSPDIDSNS